MIDYSMLIQPKIFYVGIKAIILNPMTLKVLILKREDKDGVRFWDLPGGRINESETIEQALERELQEEILNIKNFEIVKILNAFRLDKDIEKNVGLVRIHYLIKTELTEVQLSNEHESYCWIDNKDLTSLDELEGYSVGKETFEALKLALQDSYSSSSSLPKSS